MSNIPTGKKIYLCTPSLKPITVLNGIDTESANYSEHLRDYSSLTFDVYENIVVDGKQVRSNGYDLLDVYMNLYLEDIAYFQMQYPQVQNDGIKEYKSITAYSIDKEWEDKDWVNFKVNTGEKDSLEQLVENNTDDLGFTINFIDFYNPDIKDLSLIHIILEKMPNWSVDDNDIDKALWKKRLSISEDSINLYALMTSVIAPNAECIFVFDCLNRKIKAYSKSNLEFDTNIFIGFRNLASNIEQSVNEDSVFTRFNVAGGNNLEVNDWNFNNGRIFNLDYFMHEPYMSQEQVEKFRAWIDWQNEHREEFASLSQDVSDLEAKIYDLKYRVPDDGCEIDQWKNMNKEGLEESLKYYQSLLDAFGVSVDENPTYTGSDGKTYHVLIEEDEKGNKIRTIVDENNVPIQSDVTITYNAWEITEDGETHVDYNRYLEILYEMENGKAGYYTYYEIVKYIIPNIEIALWNLEHAEIKDDEKDYNKEFETKWELYGLEELKGRLEDYQNRVDVLKQYSTYPAYFYQIKRLDFWEMYALDSFKVKSIEIQTGGNTYELDDILAVEGVNSVGFKVDDENKLYVGIYSKDDTLLDTLFSSDITSFSIEARCKMPNSSYEETVSYSTSTSIHPVVMGDFAGDSQWEKLYKEYWEKVNYIGDEETENTIKWWIKELESQIDEIGAEEKGYNLSRMEMVAKVSMYETEIFESDENDYGYDVTELDNPNPEWGFTIDDINLFHTLMHDTDYTNENILTTSLNTTSTLTSTETIIQKEKELYEDAVEKLSEISQPQITFSVNMDNIMQIKEFEGLREDCSLLRFIRLGIRDDYSVKLRIVGRSWNPCDVTDDFTLEFSNMITSNSGRSDLTELLNNTSGNAGKNSISLGSGNSESDKEYAANLLALMVNNGLFASAVQGVAGTGSVDADEVNELIEDYLYSNVINEASFTKIFSTYIDVEQLVADAIKTATISTDQITDNEGHVFADLVNGVINIDTITTNIIQGQDSQGNYYIDLITGEIAIDKLVSSDGETAIEFINGAVSTDQIVTNIIQGKDGDKNYYINLLEGEIAIDRLVSSDGSTVVEFINGALNTEHIVTSLITGTDEDSDYYMNMLTGELNMDTIYTNLITGTNGNNQYYIDLLTGTIVGKQVFADEVTTLSINALDQSTARSKIINLVAQNISVSDLQAGDIVLSNQMRILTESTATEGMVMSGSEIQFLDANGNPSISIGYNTVSDGQGGTTVDYDHPAIVIKDENGSVLLNSDGLSQNDVGIAPMIQSHSVTEGKLSFDFIKTPNGDIIVQNFDGSTSTWGREITEFVNSVDDKLETPHPTDVDVVYAVSSSNIIAPLSGWDTTAPSYTLGAYVWEKVITTYENSSTSDTSPVCIQPSGEQYDSILEQYYKSTSNSTQANGSWTTTKPTWESGYYIWTRSIINWTSGDPTYSTPVLATPDQSIYASTINTIRDIATQDEQGRWSLTQGVMQNTYVYTDEEQTNPVSLAALGSSITTTTEGIVASVEKNVVELINTESDRRKALYGTCLTEADTAIKEVMCDNFELYTGATISVEFKHQNTQERPKLNVEGTGEYLIKSYKNEELSEEEYSWDAGSVLDFVFDGRRWRMLDNGSIKKISTAESRIDMNADKIRAMVTVDGQTSSITLTQNMLEAITDQFVVKSPNGSETIISGGLLSTNAIKSNNYVAPPDGPNPYSITGTFLNLANGNIYSPNFAVDNVNKHAYLNGTIHTKAGEIGGFTITENSIYNNMTSLDDEVSDEDIPLGEGVYLEAQDYYVLDEDDYLTTNFRPVLYGVYIGTDGIALGKGKFKVDAFGNMYANSATIVGNITANSLTINESANVAGLIKAINSSSDSDGGSLVKISADKIQFEGATYFDSFSKKTETVSDVVVEYAKSTSASEFIAVSGSDGEWSPTAPDWSANTYMWQRTGKTINGNTTYTYTCIQGAKGDSGGEGGSVTITSIKYAVTSTESQPADSAFTYTTVPTVPEGSWLWCLTTYSSGNKSYSKSKQGKSPVVSKSGDTVTITGADGESVTVSDGLSPIVTKSGDTVTITDGEGNTVTVKDGEKGDSVKGDDGKPAYFHIAWANSADGATDFSTTVSTNKLYMGTYTDENETDSSNYRDYKWVKVKGDQGKSLTQVTEYYARNNSTTAPADSSFGTSVLTPTANERYVWNYEVLSWNDNGETSTSKTNKHIVAVFGESGNDGKSLVSVTEYYTVNNVATNTPSYESFDTTVVSPTAENRYLWNYELLTWNDNGTTSTERTPRHIAGVYGDRGTSVTNVTSTNNTEDGGFSVITITLSDGSTKTFQVKNGNRGPKGEPGVIAQWYYGTLLEHKTGTATLVASATEGAVVGSMYLNTDTSDIYQCTEVGNPDNTWIYAGNLASGLLDSIEIGGTNILRQLPKQYSSAAYNAYQLYLSENLVANQTYTIQFWNVDVSHSGKGAANLGLSVYWGGGSINLVTMNGTDYFTDGHADYLVATFTVTETQANNTSGGSSNNWLNIYNSVPSASGTMSMSIERWKLEKGNIATDWSPVPGDLIGKVQQIYCRTNSTSLPSKPTSIVTRSDEVNTSNNSSPNWTIRRMPMIDVNNVNYRYCYTCSQWISIDGVFLGASDVVQDEAHTVIDGGNIITNTVTAAQINFADATGNTLKLQNPNTSAHFLIDGDTLQAYNSSNQLYFEVSNTGIKYGASLGTTVATTGDVSNAQTAAAADATNKADSAAWSVSISVNSINYTANTAVLKATVYKYGVEQSSGFGVQWYKNGTAISGATSLTSPEVSADATYTCIVT